VSWAYDECGYACSDHASWTNAGYPASMPFEAHTRDMNPHIHSDLDTLSASDENASHALKFARLTAAFMAELAKGTLAPSPR
jgi:leucyl aminopeptidase